MDELGGGTDPVAGAAISQAILEKILSNPSNKIVATTHSPELKYLAMTDDTKIQSACVGLDIQSDATDYRKPTYHLMYGKIGESFALGAASRCRPPLPVDVIKRAFQLMENNDDSGETLRNHLQALDRELAITKEARQEAEVIRRDVLDAKEALLAKLQSSDIYLSRIESRLQSIFQTLSHDDSRGDLILVGDSLSELSLMRRQIKSEEELLAEQGLRRVPMSYSFRNNESVVIIAEGDFKGCNGVVKVADDDSMKTGDKDYNSRVTVVPVLDLFSLDEEEDLSFEYKRSDIAIWLETDSLTGDLLKQDSTSSSKSSRSNSKKVMSILSVLNSKDKINKSRNQNDKTNTFKSSRQRKASRRANKRQSG